MKTKRWALAALCGCALLTSPTWAQTLRQPASVRPAGLSKSESDFSYRYYDDQEEPSPSDAPAAEPAAPAEEAAPAADPVADVSNTCDASCVSACGCDSCCSDGGLLGGGWGLFDACGCTTVEDLGEPYKLIDSCYMQEHNMTSGGWIAQGYTWNPYRPVDKFNGPMTWMDRANEYQLNELYWYFGKAADTGGCGVDYGYRVDLLYGTNYRWDTAAGLETDWNSGQFYGLSMPNAYFEVGWNDLTVKLGHFMCPSGYFAVGTGNNFFSVLPYTFQYGEPFTQTGFLATYKVNDKLSIGNGLNRGWDNFDVGNPSLGYMGTLNYTRDNDDTLGLFWNYSREPNLSGANGGFSGRWVQTVAYTRNFSDNTAGVLQSDFGVQDQALANGDTASWYGANAYMFWRRTCRLQWGANVEWFRDNGGFRVGQALPSLGSPDARGWAQPVGFDGDFYRVMFGPRYYFTPNMYGRVAAAADWYRGSTNGNQAQPFDDGTKDHQQVIAFDFLWTY